MPASISISAVSMLSVLTDTPRHNRADASEHLAADLPRVVPAAPRIGHLGAGKSPTDGIDLFPAHGVGNAPEILPLTTTLPTRGIACPAFPPCRKARSKTILHATSLAKYSGPRQTLSRFGLQICSPASFS